MGFSLKKTLKGAIKGAITGSVAGPWGAVGGAISGGVGANIKTDGMTLTDMMNNGGYVNGAVGVGQDALNAEMQWYYSKKASDYAFNQNLQMWNLQNAYNDPSAQMERLEKAGLNPNLVYGGGNVSGNTSGSAPSYDTPKVSYEDRSIQRQQLRMAMLDHQQRITNQAIENDLARQRLVLAERDADRSDRLADAQIDAYKANLGLTGLDYDIKHRNAGRKYQTALLNDIDTFNQSSGVSNFFENMFDKYFDAYRGGTKLYEQERFKRRTGHTVKY